MFGMVLKSNIIWSSFYQTGLFITPIKLQIRVIEFYSNLKEIKVIF